MHGLKTELEKYPENKYRYSKAEIYMNVLGLNYEDKDVDEKTFGFTIHNLPPFNLNIKTTKIISPKYQVIH